MGIYDRDYMREDHTRRSSRLTVTVYVILGIAAITAILLTSRLIPRDGPALATQPYPPGPPGVVYPLDLNTATLQELLTVPGIGPATAEHIVKNRPFKKVDDLLTIYGIGETRLRTFSRYITVTPPELPIGETGQSGR